MMIVAGIAVGLLVLGVILYPRKREGFQTATATTTASTASTAPFVATQPPANLVGNPEACRMFKSLLDSVNSQLTRADELNYPGQKELLTSTKKSLEEQIAVLQCA